MPLMELRSNLDAFKVNQRVKDLEALHTLLSANVGQANLPILCAAFAIFWMHKVMINLSFLLFE